LNSSVCICCGRSGCATGTSIVYCKHGHVTWKSMKIGEFHQQARRNIIPQNDPTPLI